MIEPTYTLQEIAELAKISLASVKRAVRDDRLRAIKLGRLWRVRAADAQRWLSEGDHPCPPKNVAPRARARTPKPPADGATAYPWEKRRQARRS
ncbi:helix-turn-helix domain-containing protein [Chloroflexales bacterium ZM16-3]|nr:helix-turn-helix domain-containing protein [Chloroflexales bacterium ZM16-3]